MLGLAVLVLEALDVPFVFALVVFVRILEGCRYPRENLWWEADGLEGVREGFGEVFFFRVGFRALSPLARAVEVDVFSFLDFPNEHAPTMLASDDAGIRELMRDLALMGAEAAAQGVLHALVQACRDEGLVLSFVTLSVPEEPSGVDRVFENLVKRAQSDGVSLLRPKSSRAEGFREGFHADRSFRVLLEGFPDERRHRRVRDDGSLPFLSQCVEVAERCAARPDAGLCLRGHAFLDFFAEVLHVVLGHEGFDGVDESLAALAVRADDLSFFDEVDFEPELLGEEPVAHVPVEPVGFLDEDDRSWRGVLLEERDHFAERGAVGRLGGLDVEKLLLDRQVVPLRVLAEEFLLCGNRVALAFLVLAANPRVQDRFSSRPPSRGSVGRGGGSHGTLNNTWKGPE